MKKELSEYKSGFVIGIRYRSNFSISDNFGSIVDTILYSKGSSFNERIFPVLQHARANEKILFNPETQNRLVVNTSNIVLEVNDISNLPEQPTVDAFYNSIIKGIMGKYSITLINRLGYINRYIITEDVLAKNFVFKTIGSTLTDVNDINLQFSKKMVIQESLVKKDVNDYHNIIFNIIKRSDKNELFLSVDFQRIYDPFLEGSSLIDISKFLEVMRKYNKESVVEWLNNNYEDGNGKKK